MASYDNPPYVEAELNYLAPMTERPRYYTYDLEPGAPRSNATHEAQRVRIHDMRPIQSQISLDREGFALLEQRSAVKDFWDEDEIRRVYYPEAEQLVASVTGASRVFIFDHTLAAASPVRLTAHAVRRASRRRTCTSTTLANPALSRCATCWAGTLKNCCVAAPR
jgi:hypothetical protein